MKEYTCGGDALSNHYRAFNLHVKSYETQANSTLRASTI